MAEITYDHKIQIDPSYYFAHSLEMEKWCNLNLGQMGYRWHARHIVDCNVSYEFIHESDASWFALRWVK